MNNFMFIVFILCFASVSAASVRITRMLDSMSGSTTQSIAIIRVSDGKLLYGYNKDKHLIPASVTKLITSAAALKLWGAHHKFKTEVFYTGMRKKGVITGDIILKGDGDPYLVSEKLWQMAADLRNLGLNKISGDLIIDQSLFPGDDRDSSRKAGRHSSANAYDAPVSALGINFNTFEVFIAPSVSGQYQPRVTLSPYPIRNVLLKNTVVSLPQGKASNLSVKRVSNSNGGATLIASGGLSNSSESKKLYTSVNNPSFTSGEIIRSFLAKEGIKVLGIVKNGTLSKKASKLYTLQGYPMSKIVVGLNNFSNNYIADVLLKRMGAAFFKPPGRSSPGLGTYANGINVLDQFAREYGGFTGNFVLKNGSGLSPENRLSSYSMANLLRIISNDLDFFPEFFASLPAAGISGTMKKRFKSSQTKHLRGKVRAKTGTLTSPLSVSSLTGYVKHEKHGLLSFSIIQNGQQRKKQPSIYDLRLSQEKILVKTLSSL